MKYPHNEINCFDEDQPSLAWSVAKYCLIFAAWVSPLVALALFL